MTHRNIDELNAIREGVRALCAEFPAEYAQDRRRKGLPPKPS